MRTDRGGYTMVELLVALVAGSVILAAAFQALTVQEKGYRTTGAFIQDQDALRISLAILESDLREMATTGGSDIGETDILMASPDSIRVRAPAQLGFVCSLSPSDKSVTAWVQGEYFEQGQGAVIFVDDDETTYMDDHWDSVRVSNASSSSGGCPTSPTGTADQKVNFSAHTLTGVSVGAPIRGYREVTYGLRPWDGGWGLARRDEDGTVHRLVHGLASPAAGGLAFTYRDASGNTTSNREAVASIEVTMVTDPDPGSDKPPSTLTSTIYLRNN